MLSTLTVTTPAPTKDLTVLARLKAELGITDTASDTLLASLIREASDAINSFCGRPEGFGRETLTETFRLRGAPNVLLLSRDIAPAVTSVTEDGVALQPADWMLNGSMLVRLCEDVPRRWTAAKVVVAYQAGYALLTDLPHDLERACLDLCTTLWAARGRDRLLRSEAVEGVMSASYLDPREGAGGLPASIAAMLGAHVRLMV